MRARPPVIAPVSLGCCPDHPRCVLCPPPPEAPDPELVVALAHHYQEQRSRPGDEVWVGFYGGAPPTDALLEAAGDLPVSVRVRPDLLTRRDAERLLAAGVVSVELDALTLDDAVLKAAGRRYRGRTVREIALTLAGRVEVGLVLAPGLPGSTHASSMADAREVARLADTARLHPVLVLEGSRLKAAHMDGLYTPLTLGEAVTTCRAMIDTLEPGVRVIRVGLQPGPDGFGRAVAGPRHSALRELVECRRVLDSLRTLLRGARGRLAEIRCAPADLSRVRGPRSQHVRTLRAECGLSELRVRADAALERGDFAVNFVVERA